MKKKTTESFINHSTLGRIYRTGDHGMMTANLGIKFLGRQDSQVKIGGYRIELNEIEYNLRKHLSLDELVVDIETINNSKRLIAYCVLEEKSKNKTLQQLTQQNILCFEDSYDEICLLKKTSSYKENLWFDRKSYRKWNDGDIDVELLKSLCVQSEFNNNALTAYEKLSNALISLTAIFNSSMIVPKYRYPSAGGLYPIHCYLSICDDEFGFVKGTYYLSPVKKSLIKINSTAIVNYNAVFYIADLKLIQPYYPEVWRDFCEIEAGHMACLLNDYLGIKNKKLKNEDFSKLVLPKSHVLIKALQISANESHLIPAVDVTICFNSDEKIKKSLNFNSQNSSWVEEYIPLDFLSTGENSKIINAAAAFIIFKTSLSNFDKGLYNQGLMERFATNKIGSVYIGNLSIIKNTKTITCCAITIGKIDRSMLISKSISTVEFNKQDLINQAYTKLKNELPDYMIPADFVILKTLPLNDNGKIDKSALPKKSKQMQPINSHKVTEPFEITVATIWQHSLSLLSQEVFKEDDFFALGGDSLKALEMLTLVKNKLGISTDLKTIFNYSILNTFCQQLRLIQYNGLIDASEFVSLKNENIALPLIVLVHPGTGTIDCYLSFAQEFDGEYELLAIQYKDNIATDLYELGAHYAKKLITQYPNRRIHLVGYSLGAYLAFEMAKVMMAQNIQLSNLALVDALPIKRSDQIFYESVEEVNLFRKVLIEDYGIAEDKIHTLLDYINARQNSLLELCNNYLTHGEIACPIVFFKAKQETPYLKNKFKNNADQLWERHSSSNFIKYEVDGNHMNIFSSKHIKSFVDQYVDFLAIQRAGISKF